MKTFISENSLKFDTFPGMFHFIMTVKYISVYVCMRMCTSCFVYVYSLCMCV